MQFVITFLHESGAMLQVFFLPLFHHLTFEIEVFFEKEKGKSNLKTRTNLEVNDLQGKQVFLTKAPQHQSKSATRENR